MYSSWNHKKTTFFSRHYFRNLTTSGVDMFGYIGKDVLPKQGRFLVKRRVCYSRRSRYSLFGELTNYGIEDTVTVVPLTEGTREFCIFRIVVSGL
jgi:hypothetical protein